MTKGWVGFEGTGDDSSDRRGMGQRWYEVNAMYSNEYRDGMQIKAALITSQRKLQFNRLSLASAQGFYTFVIPGGAVWLRKSSPRVQVIIIVQ